MSSNTGRADRRRRILNDGVRAAGVESSTHAASDAPGDVSRYGANEDSVSFAIARRLLPHRRLAIFGVAAVGVLAVASLLAGYHFQSDIAAAIGVDSVPAIDLESEQSLANWAGGVATTVIAALCLIVFGLRSHRADDLNGLYRWWMTASVAVLGGSACLATGLHQSIAAVAASQTGWQPLGNVTLWWAVPATLVLGVTAVRVLLDIKHCVPALTATIAAALFVVASATPQWGLLPEAATPFSSHIAHGGALLGMLSVVVALLCYSRRIVLEADGTIKTTVQKPTPKAEKKSAEAVVEKPKFASKKASATAAKTAATKPRLAASTAPEEPTQKPKRSEPVKSSVAKPSTTQWTDGSDGVSDYDDEPRRKLSKAERKRLRKQKARQGRAA